MKSVTYVLTAAAVLLVMAVSATSGVYDIPRMGKIVIDGKGQTWGRDYPGRIVSTDKGAGWRIVVADASKTYPGLLKKFVRTVLLIGSDTIIVRDVVECEDARHVAWLLHYGGKMRDEGLVSVIENQGVSLIVTPLLPDRSFGWRQSDVVRKSVYKNQVARTVRPKGDSLTVGK